MTFIGDRAAQTSYDPNAAVSELRQRLRELFPAALEFTFDLGGTPETRLPTISDLGGLRVRFSEDAWEDRPDGLTQPGPDTATALARLGWTPDAQPGDPVVDDFAEVTVTAPRGTTSPLLEDLWALCQEAFTRVPWETSAGEQDRVFSLR